MVTGLFLFQLLFKYLYEFFAIVSCQKSDFI